MYRYELTERGKIVIAVMLVLLLLMVPSAILLFTAIADQPPHLLKPPGPEASETESPTPAPTISPTPVITDSPPPNGGGFEHTDNTPSDNDDNDANDNNDANDGDGGDDTDVQEPSKPPETGQNGDNTINGVLSFVFSPDKQNLLDDKTMSMLHEFVNLPQNTDDSSIAIEIPVLLGEDMEKLRFALISAFTDLGIPEQRLVYITKASVIADGAFGVSLFFIPTDIK